MQLCFHAGLPSSSFWSLAITANNQTLELQGMRWKRLAWDCSLMSYAIHTHVVLYTRCVCVYISIIHLTRTKVWESMGKPCSCMWFIQNHIFYYKLRDHFLPWFLMNLSCFRYSVTCTTWEGFSQLVVQCKQCVPTRRTFPWASGRGLWYHLGINSLESGPCY